MSTPNTTARSHSDEANAEAIEAPWDELATQIREGKKSGTATPMTADDWNEVEAKIRAAAKSPAAQ